MNRVTRVSNKVFSISFKGEVCLNSSQIIASQIYCSFFAQAFDGLNLLGVCSGNIFGSSAKLYSSKVFSFLLKDKVWLTRSTSVLTGCVMEAVGIQLVPSFFKKEEIEEEHFQGFTHLTLTLLLMKGVGSAKIANPLLKRGIQDVTMVELDRLCGMIGLIDPPSRGFIEGIACVEVTNFQIGVGVCLVQQGLPQLACMQVKQELRYRFKNSSLGKYKNLLKTTYSFFSVPSKIYKPLMIEGRTIENIPIQKEASERIKKEDLYCKMELFGESQNRSIAEIFIGKINELKNLHDISEVGAEKLVCKIKQDLECLVQGTSSRVEVHFLRPSEFCKMAADSLEQFKYFLENHFTPQELNYLGKVYTDPINAAPKAFGVLAGVCAAKKAAAELLGLSFQQHAREIRFSFGRPKLTGEAWDRLNSQGLFTSESCDGDLAIGISVLETSLKQSGYVGFGIDLTNQRVKYTVPEKHARQEAAYKAVLSEHPIGQYNARTGAELVEFSPGNFAFTGKSRIAAGVLRGELNPSLLIPVDLFDFKVENTIGAVVGVPLRKKIVVHKPESVVVVSSWPEKIYYNGKAVTSKLAELAELFRAVSGKLISPAHLISFLTPMRERYRLRTLSFKDKQEISGVRSLELYGEIVEVDNYSPIAIFTRYIHLSLDNSSLPWAEGYGITVHDSQNGIGTLTTLNHLLFLRELDIPFFDVPVGKKGHVFWPKMGFDFSNSLMRGRMINEFRLFLEKNRFSLSVKEEAELSEIEHAWELIWFKRENGEKLGEAFFASSPRIWDSQFNLHPSYPGWRVLRKALKKYGWDSLLPDELGNEIEKET